MATHLPDPLHRSAGAHWGSAGRAAIFGRERRERVGSWPFYRAGYVNALLSGRLDDGDDFAVVAGEHGRNYPFFHPRSRWDDLLMVAGERRLLAAGRRLPPLTLVLRDDGSALLAYRGLAAAARGALVDVDLQLELTAGLRPPHWEGFGRGPLLLGLRWQPALVRGTGALTLDGKRRRVESLAGEMERGSLQNLRARAFRFAYDYIAVTRPGAEAAAHVAFRSFPLPRGPAGWPLRALLFMARARENLTLCEDDRTEHGDPRALAPAPGEAIEPWVESVVNLGPARLVRQLARIGPEERRRWALIERFVPRAPGRAALI
jgi:hypothetical protein